MDLAVIGTGNVGGTLAKRWADAGHKLFLGARDPQSEKTKAVGAMVPGAKVCTPSEAVIASDVILLATPWEVTEPLLTSLDLAGKVVIDCTNALKPDLSGLDLPADLSAGELVQQWAPGARVVKAFNTIGSGTMENPDFQGHGATLFFCGDDEDAKAIVADLARDIGFVPVDIGNLKAARLLEHLAMFWIHLAYGVGMGSDIAVQLVRR